MLRLITDGPGWTEAIFFFKYEDNNKPILIGLSDTNTAVYKFVEQSFNDAVSELNKCDDWENEYDGTYSYLEGENPDDFKETYADNFSSDFEEPIIYKSVKEFLNDLGYKENL